MAALAGSDPICDFCVFFNDTATTEIYTLSLHDALPILAGLVKSPSNYDLVRNAIESCDPPEPNSTDPCKGKTILTVPADTAIVQRRNQILQLLASGRTVLSKDQYSPDQLVAAEQEPVIVAPQKIPP